MNTALDWLVVRKRPHLRTVMMDLSYEKSHYDGTASGHGAIILIRVEYGNMRCNLGIM